VDVARADTIDGELDRLICKQASQDRRLDPDEQEELWKESVRRYNARCQEENRLAFCDYFGRLSARVRSCAEEYDHRAQALLEDRGEGIR
jgi:superfamily I DNA/RNA helicase